MDLLVNIQKHPKMGPKSAFGIWLYCCLVKHVWLYSISDADSLYTAITFGYNNLNRPSSTVALSVNFNLASINYLDVSSQELSVSGWFTVEWTDSRFSWDPTSYSNIDTMFLDDTNLWIPKLMIDNSRDATQLLYDESMVYRVSSSGIVEWSPPGVFNVYCSVDTSYYPYDVQTCYISIRSWSYDNSIVTLSYNDTSNNTNSFQENDEWDLVDSYYVEDDVTSNSNDYSVMKFYYKLKRKSNYYVMNVIVPLILTSFMGVLIFLLPPNSGEKIGYGVVIFLAEVVLLIISFGVIPVSSSNTPILVIYFVIILVMSVLEVLVAIIIQRIYYTYDNGNERLSGAARMAAMIIGTVVCNKSQNSRYRTSSRVESPSTPESKRSIRRTPSIIRVSPNNSINRPNGDLQEIQEIRNESAWQVNKTNLTPDRIITSKEFSESLDRFCFVLFLLAWLIVTIVYMTILSSSAS